ncbi:DNA binding methylated-DNA--cysteine S-methyltransferase [Backusella circina FSU 941]|nr:DNA binding methylated-DNA--cysteine S-methyltransferase [Backusella circina FSU 941]
MFMPQTESERKSFINPKTKRPITPFQYRVYDYCAQIPTGHVSTYKELSDALHSAPRAVGQALKLNPFAPLPVPCHRVIAASRNIGGFSGGFGDCQLVTNKKAKLMREGCVFDNNYNFIHNVDKSTIMFNDFKEK